MKLNLWSMFEACMIKMNMKLDLSLCDKDNFEGTPNEAFLMNLKISLIKDFFHVVEFQGTLIKTLLTKMNVRFHWLKPFC